MSAPVRLGVIGCGEVAQIVHLPYLSELPQFEVAALCDVSPEVVDAIGQRYQVARRFTCAGELLASGGLDAVAVLTMDHAEVAEAAAEAGLHLFVEKPLAFTPSEAASVVEAAHAHGVQLMVGYARQFDPAYVYLRRRMRAMRDVRLVRAHDFAGDFGLHRMLHNVKTRGDVPEERARMRAVVAKKLRAAVGEAAADLYWGMLMLCSHDVAMLRGLLGEPNGIVGSAAIAESGLVATLDYGARGRCVLEGDVGSKLAGWDQYLAVYGHDQAFEVQFPDPYLKHAPTLVQIRSPAGRGSGVVATRTFYGEPFRREWMQFHACVRSGESPGPASRGASADIELIAELARGAAR